MPETKEPRRRFGSLYRRRRGCWLARYPDPGGKKNAKGRIRFISRVLPSKKAAEQFLDEMEKEVAVAKASPAVEGPDEKPLTLLGAIDAYLEGRGKRLSPTSLMAYTASRNAIAMHAVASVPIAELRPRDIDEYLDWRRGVSLVAKRVGEGKARTVKRKGARAKPGTLNRDLTVIQASLGEQVREQKLERNPASLVRRRKTQESPRQAFQKTELKRLIASCSETFRPLVLAAVYTGARLGELARLTWGDIYFETNRILLRRWKVGNASAIPMHPELAKVLQGLKEQRSADDRIVKANEVVFLSERGKPYGEVRGPWRKAMKEAGLGDRDDLTFHSLRHTFATVFLEGGAAVTDLQRILGHKNLTTTQIYAHMVDARARASVEALDFGIAGLHADEDRKVHSIG